MSRQQLIMGNWKMHGTQASVHSLLQSLKDIQPKKNMEVVVFPAFVYLEKICWELRHSKIKYGAQNVSQYQEGAYTGEVSAWMLKDLGCQYVLVGHSERRMLFDESNQLVAEKLQRVLQAGLRPVLCVGETMNEKHHHQTEQIVLAQLQSVLNLVIDVDALSQLVVAYEPVWAIGTGLTATPQQAQQVHALIRNLLMEHHTGLQQTPIIYGGSVKVSNAKQLLAMPDIDGALIGGASLNAEEFREICYSQ